MVKINLINTNILDAMRTSSKDGLHAIADALRSNLSPELISLLADMCEDTQGEFSFTIKGKRGRKQIDWPPMGYFVLYQIEDGIKQDAAVQAAIEKFGVGRTVVLEALKKATP